MHLGGGFVWWIEVFSDFIFLRQRDDQMIVGKE